MDGFNKHISGIRRTIEDMKTEMYAISNPVTASLDEYTKNLYMRMLCTIIQYENVPSETQILYLIRLHKGMQLDNPVEDYMRQALDISDVDIREFIGSMKENNAKFFFTLDGILLITMGNSKHSDYEYLGELIELLGITKKELEHLSVVARSVLEQDSECYNRAKRIAPETTAEIGFAPYIDNYYAGVIVDTDYEKYYYAPARDEKYTFDIPSSFNEYKVKFRNMILRISDICVFDGCKSVEFYNCKIYGSDFPLSFKQCDQIIFDRCEFSDFTQYAIVEENVNKLDFVNCKFSDCMYNYSDNTRWNWSGLGGVIHAVSPNFSKYPIIMIRDCEFINCGGTNEKDGYFSSIICNDRCEVRNSKFINCWNYHNRDKKDPENRKRTLFDNWCIIEGNELFNSANIVEDTV